MPPASTVNTVGGRAVTVAIAALLLFPATGVAHRDHRAPGSVLPSSGGLRAAAAPASCPGDGDRHEFAPDRVITGEFGAEREGSYVMLPFEVPDATTAVRVRYCYDQPEEPQSQFDSHTLDLGLYEPRADQSRPWGIPEFRGWGGSSHPDVIVSPEGFSSAARYAADPHDQTPGKTTRAFRPGPIPGGEWAVELGLASIASQPADTDGKVAYRVEIDWSDAPSFADDPYRPAAYDRSPARSGSGWYAGDLHVHGEHSALGDAPMREVFDYAFGSLREGKAGLDFITLSDYVSGSSWGEIGRYQADYPNSLIARSAEVITYRGHANSHANIGVVDYRTGPIFERGAGGRLVALRSARPASTIFNRIRSNGGFTQINHPTIFPSPPFPSNLCRGCAWEYSDRQTNYSKVDGIEVATGPAALKTPGRPGPNPFTVTAIEFWEDALAEGHKVAAIGVSDSHNAGRTPDPVTQAPIGTATTVVYADELSERGIQRGVEAGHTYVKVTGNDAPDLRLRGRARGSSSPAAIMGDTVRGEPVDFTARVLGAGPSPLPPELPYTLLVVRDGKPFRTVPVTRDDFTYRFRSAGPGRYRLQLQRGTTIEALSSPIYVERGTGSGSGGGGGDRPACTKRGTSGNDIIRGTSGDDVICAGGGNDIVYGGGGNDTIYGGAGNDILRGEGGNDRISGEDGDDHVIGGDGDDRLRGGPGSDVLSGQDGRDHLNTRDNRGGNDVANGGPGEDSCDTDRGDTRSSC